MPLVNNMSVILIVQLVGKVCATTGCTKHGHETGVVAALLRINNTMQISSPLRTTLPHYNNDDSCVFQYKVTNGTA